MKVCTQTNGAGGAHAMNKRTFIPTADLPKALTDLNQWICWKHVPNGKEKPGKMPCTPKGKSLRRWQKDSSQWMTYDDAVAAYENNPKLAGIGFVLTEGTGIIGLDLDNAVCQDTGEAAPWAQEHLDDFQTYCEVSPSGTGYRLFTRGRMPAGAPKKVGDREIYETGRWLTITGNTVSSLPVQACEDAVRRYISAMRAEKSRNGSGAFQTQAGGDIMQGGRNTALTSIAGSRRRKGASETELLAKLEQINQEDCVPPLDRDEVASIARSMTRYAPAVRPYVDIMADAEKLDDDSSAEIIDNLVFETRELNAIEKRKVWTVIKRQTGIPFSTLEKALSAAAGKSPDHLDQARHVITQIGEQNILTAQSFVWQWSDTGVWRKCEDRTVRGWTQQVLDDSEEVTKGLVDSVTDLLKTESFKPEHEFDVGPSDCVNTLNGEVTLVDGQWQIRPHNREHYRTTQIPVKYDSTATAPRFTQFLEEIFPGEKEKQQAALEMMGYSMMAHCRHERFIILVGNGANGKSVLLRMLEMLCGQENVSGVQPSQFANKFQRAHLHGKLVNIVSEIEQGEVIADAALKSIVSGEPTTVEHKHKDPFQMRPFATCWFGTNHMPHTRDFSDALFRRTLILTFDQVFKPELGNCDPYLVEKLTAELPGIFNMALSAYSLALERGFTMPESSKKARDEWRLEADQVAQFVEDKCTRDPAGEEPAASLYRQYKYWAEDNGIHRKLSTKSFRDRLTSLGFGKRRTSQLRYVTGLRLTHPDFDKC